MEYIFYSYIRFLKDYSPFFISENNISFIHELDKYKIMSIKLLDTIYNLTDNADKLDGSHLTDIIRYYAPSSSNVLNLDDLKSTTGFQVTGWAYAGSPYVNSQPGGDGASSAATVIKFPGNYPFQIYRFYSSNDIKVRGYYSGTGWTSWATILTSDNYTTYCAPASHSHNYASTVKVGSTSYSCSSNVISLPAYPTIPTSLKCPKSLTIQLNGTSQGAWDGSADKTINITPASIGASATHSHPYLPIAGGGNLTGSAYISFNSASANSTELTNNTPFGITYGRIQSYGSMNIAADTDGSTSEYLVLTAGYSISNAVASNGLAIGYNALKWKGIDISLSNHTHSYSDGYVMTHHIIDASGLNQNTYYPVTIPIGSSPNVRIEVIVSLNSGSVPSWSTHSSGFSVRKIWEVNGDGWGTNSINRRILVSDYQHANADPARGIGQLGYSSTEYVYVRGGGKYFFKVSHGIVPTLRTSEFVGTADPYYQSVSPTTSAPAGIGRNIAYTSDIPTSLKCPASLTIQLNGTSQGAWDGSSAKTINITPASIGASASHSHPYLPLAGGTLTGNVTVYTGQNGSGLKFGSGTLNSLSNQLLWQSAEAIRFGSSEWDWNKWAGLKYNSSSKIIYLGIPDNVIFNANSAQSGGSIYTPGVSNIYIGNGTYTVYHSGNFAPGNYMPKSGGTFTGSVTFANGTWNVVGDDAAIGDYNAAGMLGLKSCNNNIPGIGFHNSAGTLLGRLQSNGSTLQWNDQTIIHSGNIGSQSVNYANYAAYLPPLYIGGQQTNPQTYFNNGIGVRVAMTGMSSKGTSYWSDTLWINGYSGGDVPNMCALHFNRDGSPRAFISAQSNQSSSYGTFYEFITGYNIGSQSVNYATSAGNANTVDGYHISVGSSAGSDANTIYYIV
jgi:hypothetical protein